MANVKRSESTGIIIARISHVPLSTNSLYTPHSTLTLGTHSTLTLRALTIGTLTLEERLLMPPVPRLAPNIEGDVLVFDHVSVRCVRISHS